MNTYSTPQFYIYAYLRTNVTPYYIGKGCRKRAWNKNHTINLPTDYNRIIIMESNLTEIGALALERFYIRWYGRKDNNTGILRNLTDGGEGATGLVITENHRQKLSIAGKGRVASKETREKMKQSKLGKNNPMYGRVTTEETREKLRKALVGRKISDYQKNILKEHNTGKIMSDETKQKLRTINLGKKASPETCKKISDALKGRKLSIEQRMKMSESQKGKVFSHEHRMKIGNASRGWIPSEETKNKWKKAFTGKPLPQFFTILESKKTYNKPMLSRYFPEFRPYF